MGKIKSAIITAIVALAVVTLLLFGLISCQLPGGVNRYNSILSNISLGSELTGDAYSVLLPEGVITADEYNLTVADDAEKAEEYAEKYVQSSGGSYYVERAVLEEYAEGESNTDAQLLAAFENKVKGDAEILSARFGDRRYTSYSVSIVEGCAIKVSVPTGFTYAAYAGNDNTALTDAVSSISTSVAYLTMSGELTLRNNDYAAGGWRDSVSATQSADGDTVTYNLLNVKYDITDIIKDVTYYAASGNYAVKVKLTDLGKEQISKITSAVASSEDTYLRFYVGNESVINLTCESAISGSSFYIQVDNEATARNYASLLSSVSSGNALSLDYTYDEVIYNTSASGTNTAMFLAIAMLIIVLAVMAFSIVRYRLLGLVSSLMTLAFADVLITAMFLIGLQLTTVGVFTCLAGLMLLTGSNFWAFEAVKKETQMGRTVQASVKRGYKNVLSSVLEIHIVLLVVAIMLALICTGEAAACGLILVISVLASYALYWFTRFMWYTVMSPVRDKYKFCGFKREAFEDED